MQFIVIMSMPVIFFGGLVALMSNCAATCHKQEILERSLAK